MAVFQTTSGYRDPAKAMSIKALEQRQKDARAASAAIEMPVISDPLQGIAHMLNVGTSSLAESAADRQAGAARQRFAEIMAQVDPKTGPNAQQAAELGMLDAERTDTLTADYRDQQQALERLAAEQTFAAGQNELQRKSTEGIATAGNVSAEGIAAAAQAGETARQDDQQEATRLAAEEKARVDAEAAKALAENQQKQREFETRFGTDEGKLRFAAAQGDISPQELQDGIARIRSEQAAKGQSVYGEPKPGPGGGTVQEITGGPTPGKLETVDQPAAGPQFDRTKGSTPGQIEVDKLLGQEYTTWKSKGGPGFAASIANIKKAQDLLRSGQADTGTIGQLLPDNLRALVKSGTVTAEQAIQTAVQDTVKEVLGTQFAAVEAEQLASRSFNPLLGPEENLRRAQVIMDKLTQIAMRKQSLVEHWDAPLKDAAGQPVLNPQTGLPMTRGTAEGWTPPGTESVESLKAMLEGFQTEAAPAATDTGAATGGKTIEEEYGLEPKVNKLGEKAGLGGM